MTRWPTAVELLEANDYAPGMIITESVDQFGYDMVALDLNGKKIVNEDGTLARIHFEWRDAGFGQRLLDAIAKDEAAE